MGKKKKRKLKVDRERKTGIAAEAGRKRFREEKSKEGTVTGEGDQTRTGRGEFMNGGWAFASHKKQAWTKTMKSEGNSWGNSKGIHNNMNYISSRGLIGKEGDHKGFVGSGGWLGIL